MVVNIGSTLSVICDNKIKATKHRVIDTGGDRYSCPFFGYPKLSARIPDDLLKSGRVSCEDFDYDKKHKKKGKKTIDDIIPFGKLIIEKVKGGFGEWKGFKVPEELGIKKS